ncbi:MAG: 4Fe-4S binding protein, partial [Clostridia bacterium]|nr:4Fe-4S binding protein [Clostridia bacterium]
MQNCLTLKKSNCKNCYKCIRHCPVKSIRFSGNQAHIINDECILCGHCFVACPQNAKQIVDETEKVKVMLQSGDPVVVSLAPSFIANYEGVGIASMREALKKLGFYDAEETAIGATIVKTEYERMLREDNRDVVIASCCHSINLLIQKYFKSCLPYLADVVSPMMAHCQDIKRRIPNAKTVFIGPCVAKKDEADHYKGVTDAVLTFEELTNWFAQAGIELNKEADRDEESLARFFPVTGGVIKTMYKDEQNYTYLSID